MDSEIQPAPKQDGVQVEQKNGTASRKRSNSRRRGSSSGSSHGLFTAAALVPAMLASSCCIPQLILNMFAFGCAGFAVLTPFRSAAAFKCTGNMLSICSPATWT